MTEKTKESRIRVYYSWQPDLPANTNQGLIERALEMALEEIRAEKKITITLEHDSRDATSSPDSLKNIFEKIDSCDIFAADITPVEKRRGHLLPNPNVLLELGYALRSLTADRIILIHNDFFGDTRLLPFDLGFKRQTTYSVSPDSETKSDDRQALAKHIRKEIEVILKL